MSISNDGWQKQASIASNIRDRGHDAIKKDMKAEGEASKTMQALRSARSASEVQRQGAADQAKVSQPSQVARDVPQTNQKARGETQAEAARHTPDAAKQFLENRDAAKNLHQLSHKAPVTTSGDRAATQAAVTQKGPSAEANSAQQGARQTGTVARGQTDRGEGRAAQEAVAKNVAQTHRPRPKDDAEGKKATENLPQADPKQFAGKEAATAAHVAAGAGAAKGAFEKTATRERGEGSEGEKKSGKKAEGGRGAKGGVYAREGNASGQLDALLSGGAGGQDSAGGDAAGTGAEGIVATDGTPAAAPEAMPETDPHFHVFSEFDEMNPGVEIVKSKAQLYGRLVEKRISEISKLNDEVASGIVSLSKRIIVGEGDGETARALAKAIGRRDSVYGMMKG